MQIACPIVRDLTRVEHRGGRAGGRDAGVYIPPAARSREPNVSRRGAFTVARPPSQMEVPCNRAPRGAQPSGPGDDAVPMNPRILIAALAATILTPPPLPALADGPTRSFYVGPKGSDRTGNGSQGAPWASLRHATTVMPDLG